MKKKNSKKRFQIEIKRFWLGRWTKVLLMNWKEYLIFSSYGDGKIKGKCSLVFLPLLSKKIERQTLTHKNKICARSRVGKW